MGKEAPQFTPEASEAPAAVAGGHMRGAASAGNAGAARVTATVVARTPEHMRELGRRLAALLRPGDLVLLTGELGAGKTTLTRGLGEGLGVRGDVTSPTFVIARVHPSLRDGPPLVHADAYRLGGGLEEMEDLDLDVSLPESVVAVEWGEGRVEELSEDRLHVMIERTTGGSDAADALEDGADDVRTVTVTGVGARWAGTELTPLGRLG